MTSLATRCRQPEQMDQPGLDPGLHERALGGLGRINVLSRSASILWTGISGLAPDPAGTPVRVLDLACGGGDVAIALARRAAQRHIALEVAGCDLSSRAVDFARRQAEACGLKVPFFPLDALHDPLPTDYDVLTCSLFLHHLDEPEAIRLLGRMAQAVRRLVLVNDLVRSRLGYLLAVAGCRLLTRSPVVHVDGPLSVAAAFTPSEALALARRAGWEQPALTRHWPQRYLLSWSRN